jgi:hypothetical protein
LRNARARIVQDAERMYAMHDYRATFPKCLTSPRN